MPALPVEAAGFEQPVADLPLKEIQHDEKISCSDRSRDGLSGHRIGGHSLAAMPALPVEAAGFVA
jgi:hypothetical protein